MAYNESAVSNTAIAFQKPITLQQGRALRDNPIAMLEGAPGAPRLQFNAIGNWYSSAWEVGSLAFLCQVNSVITNIVAGTSYAGSTLSYGGASIAGGVYTDGVELYGTWRALGSVALTVTNTKRATLFIRIA